MSSDRTPNGIAIHIYEMGSSEMGHTENIIMKDKHIFWVPVSEIVENTLKRPLHTHTFSGMNPVPYHWIKLLYFKAGSGKTFLRDSI